MFTKLVRICLAVLSLAGFSHRIFKHKTIVKWNILRENIRQCFIFSVAVRIVPVPPIFSVLLIYSLKINRLLFWPTMYIVLALWDGHWATVYIPPPPWHTAATWRHSNTMTSLLLWERYRRIVTASSLIALDLNSKYRGLYLRTVFKSI